MLYEVITERELLAQLLDGLRRLPTVTVCGPAGNRRHGGALSFTLAGVDPAAAGYQLDNEYDICVRVGLHCAPEAHRSIGTFPGGTIRVSPGWFTTAAEIETLLVAIRTLAASRITSYNVCYTKLLRYMNCNSAEETMQRFGPLTRYLSERLGVNFEAVPVDTQDFEERFKAGEFTFTHTNSILS